MSLISLLNLTCSIQTKSVAYSTTGSPTTTFIDKATNVKCAVQPRTGGLVSAAYSETLGVTHVGFFQIGANIVAGDKVVVGSTEYIVKLPIDAAGRAHHKEVGLELVA